MFDAKGLVRPRDFLEGPVHAAIAILRHPALGKDGLKSILTIFDVCANLKKLGCSKLS